jgi:hypothetical protein
MVDRLSETVESLVYESEIGYHANDVQSWEDETCAFDMDAVLADLTRRYNDVSTINQEVVLNRAGENGNPKIELETALAGLTRRYNDINTRLKESPEINNVLGVKEKKIQTEIIQKNKEIDIDRLNTNIENVENNNNGLNRLQSVLDKCNIIIEVISDI